MNGLIDKILTEYLLCAVQGNLHKYYHRVIVHIPVDGANVT